jgi:hypothetical protein
MEHGGRGARDGFANLGPSFPAKRPLIQDDELKRGDYCAARLSVIARHRRDRKSESLTAETLRRGEEVNDPKKEERRPFAKDDRLRHGDFAPHYLAFSAAQAALNSDLVPSCRVTGTTSCV